MITLATLHVYSAQQVFDYISRHLLTQGEKCQEFDDNMNPACVYRNSDQSCAAGCLISEEEYGLAFEGKDWNALTNRKMVPDVHRGLIYSMQRVHDGRDANGWYKALQQVAGDYNFDTTNLDMYAMENNYC